MGVLIIREDPDQHGRISLPDAQEYLDQLLVYHQVFVADGGCKHAVVHLFKEVLYQGARFEAFPGIQQEEKIAPLYFSRIEIPPLDGSLAIEIQMESRHGR